MIDKTISTENIDDLLDEIAVSSPSDDWRGAAVEFLRSREWHSIKILRDFCDDALLLESMWHKETPLELELALRVLQNHLNYLDKN